MRRLEHPRSGILPGHLPELEAFRQRGKGQVPVWMGCEGDRLAFTVWSAIGDTPYHPALADTLRRHLSAGFA